MITLALDLGTRCGYAIADGDRIIGAGTWNLSPRRYEGAGMRYLRFRVQLDQALSSGVGHVVVEEVHAHVATEAAHVYGGLLAIVQSLCEERSVPYEGVTIQAIKRRATGKGNANKDAMLEAARRRWPDFAGDDNEADARWLADLVIERDAVAR